MTKVTTFGTDLIFSIIPIDTRQPDANLDCSIKNFILNDSMIVQLDTSVLNPDMLLLTERISIQNSVVENVHPKLFEDYFFK